MDYGLQHVMGNLLSESYEDILESEESISIRNDMKGMQDDPHILCKHCTNARSMEEIYDDYDNQYSWNKIMQKNEKGRVKEVFDYKNWVANQELQILELKELLGRTEDRYDERIKRVCTVGRELTEAN